MEASVGPRFFRAAGSLGCYRAIPLVVPLCRALRLRYSVGGTEAAFGVSMRHVLSRCREMNIVRSWS